VSSQPRLLRVLVVEDSPTDTKLIMHQLERTGRPIELERVETSLAMREALARKPWDVILADWTLPAFSALAALAILAELELDVPFIIVSGTVGEDAAVEAMRSGAHDYVLKDKLARLNPAVERELRQKNSRDQTKRAEEARAALEEQLRQSQKMEAVGRLAGGIAHDFNNALSVILSYADLICEELEVGSPMLDSVDEIRKAGVRAADLTRQLLMFSRQQVVEPKVLDLSDVLSEMTKMLQRVVGEDVELTSVTAPSLGRVRIDPGSIQQLIMNLVVNARDAMPTGGQLTLETADVVLDADYAGAHLGATAGPSVMLCVSDTGTGMDKATLGRIFEPFFTTKEIGKGTGLGLSTVFGIVKQGGGNIFVYSEVGVGTSVKIYLPRVDAPAESTRASRPAATPCGTETILLVEDEEPVRAVAREILRRHGYAVLEACNGGEALLLCEHHAGPIDLLLSDVVMPGMTGTELARRVVPLRPDIKVICMSGYTGDAAVRNGVAHPSIAFLQKPFTVEGLTKKVREVLDGAARTAA
jgi:two-component system, cell cycle sensor histidine kinase and response regulator CckA